MAEKEKTEKNTEKINRDKALELALSQIEKQHGKGSIMRLGDERAYIPVEVISTGALNLDVALGVGGLPRGRVTEIYGPEASGKTTLSLHVIANAQKTGGKAAFIDVEHALDAKYAKILGVDLDNLLVSQPDTGEQALDITEVLIRSNAMDVIVIDSVAALVPRAELEGDMGDSHMGLQARLMSQALRKLTSSISKSRTICIFINQIRMKIGVMWGSPETTTGGKALKFYASIRLDIRRTGNITGENDVIIGSTNRVKVVKNKVAPPFRQAIFEVFYNQGISWEGSVVDAAAEHGVLEKAGAWYSYNGVKIGQGREAVKKYLKEHPEVSKEIVTKVKEKVGIIQPASKGKGDK